MPLNLLKKYNELLDVLSMTLTNREESFLGVFNRDIVHNVSFTFRKKQINPTPLDGEIKMSVLFTHLTSTITDKKTRSREFDLYRSIRLHWIKHHIEERKKDNVHVFSVKEPNGVRTYIYDVDEKYVIVLEPLRNKNEYYLLTAYPLRGKDAARNKFKKKYKRKLPEVL
ncbi:MAG: hypothetical protein DRJ10_01950 [Bacteroidetes bacterium]|nr:MAG: hypothetical protein DRI89_14595 [Bacteroidota bacterium]RLD84172.1 MAG: hypothetical protein DRJ10_01950 [Bacteroidota bacterium]